MKASIEQLTLLVGLGAGVATPVLAEPPMSVDDAGTLAKGGMKIEGAWAKEDKARCAELVFGLALLENLEISIAVTRATGRADDPSTLLRGIGISFKWVPIQNDAGWSLGASFGHGHTRINDPFNVEKFTEKENAFSALATYRFANAQAVHLNLGTTRYKAPGKSEALGTWGVGFEQPLAQNLKLAAEVFGTERSRADKAIGLRHEVAEGFKISAALGRGNDRSFGQIGFAWEF